MIHEDASNEAAIEDEDAAALAIVEVPSTEDEMATSGEACSCVGGGGD